jgi:hypothetical protein
VIGRKLPALFERCGLEEIRHEASTEVVRGGSPWGVVCRDPGGHEHTWRGAASEVQQREHERIVATFADPSTWVLRELLHAGWGRRARQGA